MTSASKLVDYEAMAPRYRSGRALSDEVLDRWGAAVRPHLAPLPDRAVRVADVGAGTGIFAAAWPRWAEATVVAVEPTPGMIAEGDPSVSYVRGRAEGLPVASRSIDVVWVSTALHHFTDQARAIAELDRVLDDGGRVMVRTFLPERSGMRWFAAFPGRERAMARCIGLDPLSDLLGVAGFVLHHVGEVTERTLRFVETADWVERMRHADSLLTALTDDEVDEGIRVLRATPDERTTAELSLVVFERAGTGEPVPPLA